jgi:hypothetical protein
MVALIVRVMGVVVPWLVSVAVMVMGMKWSGPHAVAEEARIASAARERILRRVVRRFRARPINDTSVRGKNAARRRR